ncbi:TPA: ead/Ea22-like family protein [Citrobacter farmeri]
MKCGELSHEYLLFVKEPKNVLALLGELKSAENNLIDSECHVAELEEALCDKQALLEASEKRIAEQSAIVAAAEKLVRCKGRYHSEQNYRALAVLFGVTTPDLPPLEGEALLDELEAKDVARSAQDYHFDQQADRIKSLEKSLEAAENRIAELEARTVNLPKRSVGEVMHMSGFSRDYAEGWCAGNDNAIHEIRAAGIGKGE